MRKQGFIALDRGGESWQHWKFGRYGNAREWRLQAPTGEHFTAAEVLQARSFTVEVDYLQSEVTRLRAAHAATAYHFSDEQVAALVAASVILSETFNPRARRRA